MNHSNHILCSRRFKRIITAGSFLILLTMLLSACSKESGQTGGLSSFQVITLRKQQILFTDVESGSITIPKENIIKMTAFTPGGEPVYSTSELAGSFSPVDRMTIADNSGFCVKFTVPHIKLGDYCVINAVVIFPEEISFEGKSVKLIDSDYRYTSKNSGKTEYIWFLFDGSAPELKKPGRWELRLSSGSRTLFDRIFTLSSGK